MVTTGEVLTWNLFWIFIMRAACRRVDNDSCPSVGLMHAIIRVLVLPPNEDCSNLIAMH